MKKLVITCQLPINKLDSNGNWIIENGSPVFVTNNDGTIKYETNYFCGFRTGPTPQFKGVNLIEWDTDRNFAKVFPDQETAEFNRDLIETGEPISINEF
jgi:hypothetical protein